MTTRQEAPPGAAGAGEADVLRTMFVLATAAFASSASMRVTDALLPQLADQFATTTGTAAIVITAFSLAYGLLQIIYGPIGDRFGKIATIAGGTALAGIATMLAGFAGSFEMLVAMRFASGATAAAIIPLALAWIGDVVPYERRQQTLARFMFGGITGLIFGQAAGGIVGDLVGWRAVFWMLGGLLLLTAAALAFEVLSGRIPRRRSSSTPFGLHHMATGLAVLLARPWVRTIAAIVFWEGFLLNSALAFMGADLHHRFGLSLTASGLGLGLIGLGGTAYIVAARPLVRRLGEPGLARVGGLLAAIALAAFALAPNWLVALPAVFAAGLGFYMHHNTLQTNATQMAPDARGSAVALFASSYFLGQAIGVALVGAVVDRIGTVPVMLAAAAGVAVLALDYARRLVRRAATD